MLTTYLKVPVQTWIVVIAIFVAAGAVLSALFKLAVGGLLGSEISLPDRVAGAAFGALRVAVLALLVVVVFDRLIPPGMEPKFLQGSQWRPILSTAGQQSLQSLPPEIENFIDRLRRQRRI